MISFISTITYSVILIAMIFVYVHHKYCELINSLNLKNAQVINLYMDKKFICKLLKGLYLSEDAQSLENLAKEVFHYFFIDFIAIKAFNDHQVYQFTNRELSYYLSDSEVNNLLVSEYISEEDGHINIENDLKRQIILFHNDKLHMLAVIKDQHKLTQQECSFIGNEIMLLFQLVLNGLTNMEEKNFEKLVYNFSNTTMH